MINNKISKQEAIKELWRRANLSYLLDSNQKSLYNLFHETDNQVMVWLLGRRSGKSYSLCTLANEQCIRKPKSIVKYLCPTKLMANQIIRPLMNQILEDCPKELRPEFREKDFTYFYPNGSEIQLAGSESGHANKLRGISCDIAIVDEAGEVTDLDHIVKFILFPTTLTTNGKIIISGTPPREPDHDFVRYIEEYENKGALIKRTIDDVPRLTNEQKQRFIEEMGGINSEAVRRELYCEIIRDSSVVVLPEFTEDLMKDIIKEHPVPPHSDNYVAMDLGYRDLTAVVFGYYDFRAGKYIIQDELMYDFSKKENNITNLTELIRLKEEKLWTNPYSGEVKHPKKRVSDINHIVTNEIRVRSGNLVTFTNARKDDKEAAINFLRTLLGSKKIIIDPKCKYLIRHLKNAKWSDKSNRLNFARDPEDGHYDFVDALIYWTRAVDTNANPYPIGYGYNVSSDLYIQNKDNFSNAGQLQVFKKIFNKR